MNMNFLKLENLRQRLENGEQLKECVNESGAYFVHLTNEPPISFDDKVKVRAENMLKEYGQMK